MKKYAFLLDNIVAKIATLSDEEYSIEVRKFQNGINIDGIFPEPEVGWSFQGIDLTSISAMTNNFLQQKTQRLWGQSYIFDAIDKIGERNLDLAQAGQTVNTTSLLQNMRVIKELMITGALKTARTVCLQIGPAYPIYEDLIQDVANDIQTFLVSKGYA